MFLITESGVQEQEGNAEYYLFPKDIEFLAKNIQARAMFLASLGTTKILKPEERSIILKDFINYSSSLHSRL